MTVAALQILTAQMEEDMITRTDSTQKIEAVSCTVRASFREIDECFFDSNFVLQEDATPRFLMCTSMSDTTGSMQYVKIWTKAICEILMLNPNAVLAAWQACDEEKARAEFLEKFNNALKEPWDCAVTVSPWSPSSRAPRADVNIQNAAPAER